MIYVYTGIIADFTNLKAVSCGKYNAAHAVPNAAVMTLYTDEGWYTIQDACTGLRFVWPMSQIMSQQHLAKLEAWYQR